MQPSLSHAIHTVQSNIDRSSDWLELGWALEREEQSVALDTFLDLLPGLGNEAQANQIASHLVSNETGSLHDKISALPNSELKRTAKRVFLLVLETMLASSAQTTIHPAPNTGSSSSSNANASEDRIADFKGKIANLPETFHYNKFNQSGPERQRALDLRSGLKAVLDNTLGRTSTNTHPLNLGGGQRISGFNLSRPLSSLRDNQNIRIGNLSFDAAQLKQEQKSLSVSFNPASGLTSAELRHMLNHGSETAEQDAKARHRTVSSLVTMVADARGNLLPADTPHMQFRLATKSAPNLGYSPIDKAAFIQNQVLNQQKYLDEMKSLITEYFLDCKRHGVEVPVLPGIGQGAFVTDDLRPTTQKLFIKALEEVLSSNNFDFSAVVFAGIESEFVHAVRQMKQSNAGKEAFSRLLVAKGSSIDVIERGCRAGLKMGLLNPGDPSCIAGQFWENGHIALEEMLALFTTMLFSQHPCINPQVGDKTLYHTQPVTLDANENASSAASSDLPAEIKRGPNGEILARESLAQTFHAIATGGQPQNVITMLRMQRATPQVVGTPTGVAVRFPMEYIQRGLLDKLADQLIAELDLGPKNKVLERIHYQSSRGKFYPQQLVIPYAKLPAAFERFLKVAPNEQGPLVESLRAESPGMSLYKPHFSVLRSAGAQTGLPRSCTSISLSFAHLDQALHEALSAREITPTSTPERDHPVPFVEADELGLKIYIPRDGDDLKLLMEDVFMLSSEPANLSKFGKQFDFVMHVERDEIPLLLERMQLTTFPPNIGLGPQFYQQGWAVKNDLAELGRFHPYQPPTNIEDSLRAVEAGLGRVVPNDSTVKPQATLHPNGSLIIRFKDAQGSYANHLSRYLQQRVVPCALTVKGNHFSHEMVIPADALKDFLERKLKLPGAHSALIASTPVASFETLYGDHRLPSGKKEVRIANTIARTLLSVLPEYKQQLMQFKAEDKPELTLPLPLIEFNAADGMHIWIPQELVNKKVKLSSSVEMSYVDYLNFTFGLQVQPGAPIQRFGHTYPKHLLVPTDQLRHFVERDLGLRELHADYVRSPKRPDFAHELTSWYFASSHHDHATVSEENLKLNNPSAPAPAGVAPWSQDQVLQQASAILGQHPKKDTYLASLSNIFEITSHNPSSAVHSGIRAYLFAIMEKLKNDPTIDSQRKRSALVEIGEGCGSGICTPGRLTKLQLEYQRLLGQEGVSPLLLQEVEEYKNSVLSSLFGENNSHSVHAFSAAQVLWGEEFGLSVEAGKADENWNLYGTWQLSQTHASGKPMKEAYKALIMRQDEMLDFVYDSLKGRADEFGSLLNVDLYQDALRKLLTDRGYSQEQVEAKLATLLPTDENTYQVSLTKDAVKLLLISIGVLNP